MAEFDTSAFLASFFDEVSQRLQSINQQLVLLESGKIDDEGVIQLRREAHNIKGSAQMLGVQDIGELAHLFEDALDATLQCEPEQRQSLMQFLYDLHDSLQQRLQYVDGKSRLDVGAKREAFTALQTRLQQAQENSVDADPTKTAKAANKKIRKKRTKVPKNLIAAVMGSIEGSLQAGSPQAGSADSSESRQPVETANFRPDLTGLEMDSAAAVEQGSGNFLRVDRARFARLSNQIIELGSGRYMVAFPEQKLQQAVQGFGDLKQSMLAGSDQQPQAAWQGEFERQLRQLQQLGESMRSQQQRSTTMLDDLRDQVLGLMLRPLNTVFSVFPRTVRDVGKRSGKKVQLLLAGDAVEMDQEAAEKLTAPLVHLINNAVAHGIESPAERQQCGKPEQGQISIIASQKGSDVEIIVSDDGKGMDIDLIRDSAIAKGIISQAEAAEMDASEIMELIFQPGFSTHHEVDDLAGRGMGMSVVQATLHELTGTIHIHSEQGHGTRFSLTIPASIAVRQAMVLSIAGQRFGLLANLVRQVIPYSQQEIKTGHGPYSHGYIDFEHHRVPIIDLHRALKQQREEQPNGACSVIIVKHLEGFLGLVVDEIEAEKEILVREMDPYLKRYQPLGLMGCTITHDGAVLLLIDPDGLKEMWRTAPDPELAMGGSGAFNQCMMLVDDSSIALEIEKSMFEAMGFSVDTAIGGTDALEKIGLHHYDLLVTDLGMPEIDGIELITRIRTLDKYQDLPILMLATLESEHEKQGALAAGANAYLVKRRLKNKDGKLERVLAKLLQMDKNPVIDEDDG
jgi:chemotaxis protein histidine kinase CheA/ActR/RegA family two-component response regulator